MLIGILIILGASVLLAADATLVTTFIGPDPVACGTPKTATIRYQRDETVPGLRGYEITIGVNGPAEIGDIVDAGGLAGAGLHQMYVVDNGDGTFTVSDALLGSTPGLLENADFFTVDVIATGSGMVELAILSYKLRDPDNIAFYATTSGASFTADCTLPPAVTNLHADPGHQKVLVSWAMADESDVVGYEIYRGLYYAGTPGISAYPEYDDLSNDMIPTRPLDRTTAASSAEWVLAGTTPPGTFAFTDGGLTGRGVYYYEVFPIDSVGNGGAAAAANARATNYWLGDVDLNYDGFVNVADISRLGATFGLSNGQPGYFNEADVGPTDIGTDMGVPLTDNDIDFEDLMIFSLNFSNVDPYKALPPAATRVALAWKRVSETGWSLELTGAGAALQGLHLAAGLPEGVDYQVREGALLAQQAAPVFLRDIGGLDISLAILGHGLCLNGPGQLLSLEFSRPVDPGRIEITARGTDNHDLVIDMAIDRPDRPTSFALSGNFPNPFNPSTTIAYDLPRREFVRLAIYAVDGRLVRLLVAEPIAAGRRTATWDGRDGEGERVASGLYFCRIDAGDFQDTRKMLLMK